jgi:hypothetical protein
MNNKKTMTKKSLSYDNLRDIEKDKENAKDKKIEKDNRSRSKSDTTYKNMNMTNLIRSKSIDHINMSVPINTNITHSKSDDILDKKLTWNVKRMVSLTRTKNSRNSKTSENIFRKSSDDSFGSISDISLIDDTDKIKTKKKINTSYDVIEKIIDHVKISKVKKNSIVMFDNCLYKIINIIDEPKQITKNDKYYVIFMRNIINGIDKTLSHNHNSLMLIPIHKIYFIHIYTIISYDNNLLRFIKNDDIITIPIYFMYDAKEDDKMFVYNKINNSLLTHNGSIKKHYDNKTLEIHSFAGYNFIKNII